MSTPATRHLTVRGCRLAYRVLGDPTGEPAVLVHGGGAHGGWWDDVVPLLEARLHLLVPDLSGHGDSAHRDRYSAVGWADEIAALATHVGWRSFSLIGHSMGGKVGMVTAAIHSDRVDRLVLVDSTPRVGTGAGSMGPAPREVDPRRPHRAYATLEEAVDRFRLRPGPSIAAPQVLRRLAMRGLGETPQGWTWKFDPHSRRRIADTEVAAALGRVRCPVAVVYGDRSPSVSSRTLVELEQRLGRPVIRLEVEGAYHHVPVDQPEACGRAVLEALSRLDRRLG